MGDERRCILTPEGAYLQDEDGQGWSLIPGTEEHEYVRHRLTNEEVEQVFAREIEVAKLREAVDALCTGIQEVIRFLRQFFNDFLCALVPTLEEIWRQLQEASVGWELRPHRKPQRPNYNARPKCHTHAKTRRDRKQRSRER